MKRLMLLMTTLLFIGIGVANAQISKVTGIVTSNEDGLPVVGATVVVKGTDIGTVTDADGKFTINKVPASAKTLEIKYMGMETRLVPIKATVKVGLDADSENLDEVMVVAYGTAKKSAFTGSASVIKTEAIEMRQVSNVTQALSGTMAGVQTTYSTGQPGTSATVRIRGVGSMSAGNAPLYVVDGIPFDGDISSINTQDIESMTVLKDAAAAALYGARGANGVILITTKKGKNGEAKINFEARWGVNSRGVENYDVMTNPDQYMEALYRAKYNAGYGNLGYSAAAAHQYANAELFPAVGYQMYTLPQGEGLIGTDGKINPNATLGYSDGTHYYTPDDWEDETIESQMRQEYNLSITGGNNKLNYYLSAGYLEDGGIIEGSGFNRFTTRLNADYQAKKWLKVGANMSYTNSESFYPGEQTATNSSGNAFNLGNTLAPIYPMYVRDAAGNIMYDEHFGNPLYDYGDGQSTPYTRNYMNMSNPKGDLTYDSREYLMDIFNGKWFAEITPIEGLKLTASWGLHMDYTRLHNYENRYYGQSASSGGSTTQDNTRDYAFNQQYLISYIKSFGKHNIDLLAGYESYELNSENSYAYGEALYKDNDFTVNNTINMKTSGGSVDEYATRGFLGRVNYNWDEKYFGSFSYRRDASSVFHPDNRWGNFFSASAAWMISKEKFMEDVTWVNMLKLKASFGEQGNDYLTYGSGSGRLYGYRNYVVYQDQYQMTGADGVFSDGTLVYKGNPDLTWEKSNAYNIGVDFDLFNHKLSGTIEYYGRKTSDMLYYKPVAASNGYSQIPMNIGSMTNSGIEVELNYQIMNRKNFKWDVFFNATTVKNEINELHPDLNGEWISGSRIYKEGESMYNFYLVKYAGVDVATGKGLYWANDIKYDENTGEEISRTPYLTDSWNDAYSTAREATGDILPDVYGGFGTNIEYRGFDLSISLAYQLGGKIIDSGYQSLMHAGTSSSAGTNWHKDILKAWTPENPYTDVPALNSMDTYANQTSDRWLVSSDYLSINNITLGYTLPKKLTRKLQIESLRIYGAADNLALFSARQGLDPRQSYLDATNATYGALRTISGGVKLTF
ncbi:MAG: TonB-dependent receptor [Bacteroidaceae bacterium]|nr:TonB-dependent receptor [Bacteroidaceae bacterium]